MSKPQAERSENSGIPSTANRTGLIDIGANLTHDSFNDDRVQVLQRAWDKGITQMVVTGASVKGSEDSVTLASHQDRLFATVGIHPHHAEQTNDDVLARFTELAQDRNVKAIGETGLDFFRDFSPRDMQIRSFEHHIELATRLALPMFLHERDAYPTLAEVLKPTRDQLKDVVVHCFTGEKEALHAYLDLDCHIGITGWICDERRGSHLIDLIKDIPADRLLIETDSPYLLPRNVKPKPKSRRNEPHYLTVVCEFIAAILDVSYNELAQRTANNAQRFFNLPSA
ncbi:MAG: TatD family hydrolase [Gammaproteobacteria bacterium]|nr:TatD family hydrolase [Gammaproteobacteria bacterium]